MTDDTLQPSEPLRDLLSSLAKNYIQRGEAPEIEFTEGDEPSRVNEDGSVVTLNVDHATRWDIPGASQLRLLVNTLSHEVEHINESDLTSKKEFMEEHDDGYAKLAGMVSNVLEDQYIDRTRTERFPGLKLVREWETKEVMKDDDLRPPMGELEPEHQAFEGFVQIGFTGGVKEPEALDDEVAQALDECKDLVEQARHEPSADRRLEIADECMELLRPLMPDREDLPEWLEELLRELAEDLAKDMGLDEVPEDENFDPEEVGDDGEESDDAGGSGGDDEGADEGGDQQGGAGGGDGEGDDEDPDGDGEGGTIRTPDDILGGYDPDEVRVVN